MVFFLVIASLNQNFSQIRADIRQQRTFVVNKVCTQSFIIEGKCLVFIKIEAINELLDFKAVGTED